MLQTRSLHADPGGKELDLDLSSSFGLFDSPSWSSLSLHLLFAAAATLSLFSSPAPLHGLSFLGLTFIASNLRLESGLGRMLFC